MKINRPHDPQGVKPVRPATALLVCMVVACFTALPCGCAVPGSSPGTFVKIRDARFERDGRPYFVAGVNFWQALNLAVAGKDGDRARLRRELDRLHGLGLDNVRVMAAIEGPNGQPYRVSPAMMTSPGVYDDRLLDALDYLVAEIADRRMTAVLVLTNFWEWSGGMAQYVSWESGEPIPYPAEVDWKMFCRFAERFYESDKCNEWYRNHIRTLIERRNPLTGRTYREEPAILAWELANEPRYYPAEWIEDTARFIKALDPNHLVTTGSEGRIGGPFVDTHGAPSIDYATVHIWPQNWGWYDPRDPSTLSAALSKSTAYVDEHLAAAATIDKPVVVEEFGLARDAGGPASMYAPDATTVARDRFFKAIGEQLAEAARSGAAVGGFNVWAWSGEAGPDDAWTGDPPHEVPGWYSVFASDASTLRALTNMARVGREAVTSNARPNQPSKRDPG